MKLILVIVAMLIINTGKTQNIYKDLINDSSIVIPIQISEQRIYPDVSDTLNINDSTKIVLPADKKLLVMKLLQTINEDGRQIIILETLYKALRGTIEIVLKHGCYTVEEQKDMMEATDTFIKEVLSK